MLLHQTHINAAMNMSAMGVSFALRNNGYEDDSVLTASFSGMTTHGSFVYECTYFDDHEGRNKDCKVYVHYNSFYILVADY